MFGALCIVGFREMGPEAFSAYGIADGLERRTESHP